MNPQSVVRVRTSWQQVRPQGPTVATLFYENLFAAQPALRSLFKTDLDTQGRQLVAMLDAAVQSLDDLPTLVPVLQRLGSRHAGYGVRDEHYAVVGAALLKTLSQGLGDAFTPAVRDAWVELYDLVASTMTAAAREPA